MKKRIIQESVPGRQVTIAHIVAQPQPELYTKIGLSEHSGQALGILTITPGEGAIIAADIAAKAGPVTVAFMDRFSGAVMLTGEIAAVEVALEAVLKALNQRLKITSTAITKT